jgi:hypothetical protein
MADLAAALTVMKGEVHNLVTYWDYQLRKLYERENKYEESNNSDVTLCSFEAALQFMFGFKR